MVSTGVRVRAPQLQGAGGWINTQRPLDLTALRGRVVVLDFWTFACVNCLHVIDELRPLEAKYPDEVVVIGVHSPKFAHESEHASVVAAVARLEIHHPVLDDPGMLTWRQYAIKAWPTLVVIDPEGYVVAQAAGEGQVSALDAIIAELLATHRAKGTLIGSAQPASSAPVQPGALYFPARAIVVPAARSGRAADSLLVADAGRHALTELTADSNTSPRDPSEGCPSEGSPSEGDPLEGNPSEGNPSEGNPSEGSGVLSRIGSGRRGRADGPASRAEFAEPNGLALLPLALAETIGYDVIVADTANHLLRGVRLCDGSVRTVADLAEVELHTITGRVPPVMSPWDVAWWPAADIAVVAAAGVHLLLSFDPRSGAVAILAGTTVEGLRDGDALDGWLAQPSGLAADGERMWFADAETSALRWLDLRQSGGPAQLHTAIGEGLFDFGHVDGPAAQARLQHPLGVAVLADAVLDTAVLDTAVLDTAVLDDAVSEVAVWDDVVSAVAVPGGVAIAIADTFNGAVRRFDPSTGEVTTLADGLSEPSGLVMVDGTLIAVESTAHRLTAISRETGTETTATGEPMRVERPVTDLGFGQVTLRVDFTPAPGRVVDERFGPATRLDVSSSPPGLLLAGAGASTDLIRTLALADPAAGGPSEGVLHVSAQAASCDHDPAVANPACYLSRQDWGIPLRISADGPAELELVLLG